MTKIINHKKRLAIFAHFDKQSIVDPYVITYIKELKNYIDDIIFISDGDLAQEEQDKISHLCVDVLDKRHGEYDFGSYKRGFELLKDKYRERFQAIDELIFINDSCYLVGSFKRVFDDMTLNDDCDAWGLTENIDKGQKYHMQSYFLVFRKSVFQEKFFGDFMGGIAKLNTKRNIVDQYEIGLSQLLLKNNKKLFVYFNINKVNEYCLINNNKISNEIYKILGGSFANEKNTAKNATAVNLGFPLLKRGILGYKVSPKMILLFFWQEVLITFNPSSLRQIQNHSNRLNFETKDGNLFANRYKYLFSKIKRGIFHYKKDINFLQIRLLFLKITLSDKIKVQVFGISFGLGNIKIRGAKGAK
jgi:hypothetical protein